ncbi:MAG: hypothetical protein ACYCU7_03230 [Acidimicrobiales bacterium]
MIRACAIPAPRCGFVGRGVQLHHILVCDEHGAYVQPEILLPLCGRSGGCHQDGIHRLLAAQRLDGPMPATPGVIVGRIAVTLGWLVWRRSGTVTLDAALLTDLCDVLAKVGFDLRRREAGL